MECKRAYDGVLSRACEREMKVGELCKCVWLDESVCIILDKEVRKIGQSLSYRIFYVHDFLTGERYWVDEDDLEKL